MCGLSDFSWRSICRRMGASLTYTQMVSSVGMVHGDAKTLTVLDMPTPDDDEPNPAIQVFGADPETLAESVRVLADLDPPLIDLNMGCPARKVTAGGSGAALLCDLHLVVRILRAMRRATQIPLTVKMRWGWDADDDAALQAARIAQEEGFDAVCLHARTRAQGYSGEAQWEMIGRIKEAVTIPIIGNGDIRRPVDALEMMRVSGCDAVMIGRALIGDPWLMTDALEAVRTGHAPEVRRMPDWSERRAMMLHHAELMGRRHGERGLIRFRKHAVTYLRGLPGARHVRERLMRVRALDELSEALLLEVPDR